MKQMMIANRMRKVLLIACMAMFSGMLPFVAQADEIALQIQKGTLVISAQWIHQPIHLAACAKYHNPFNNLGALMGGHSKSRGKCYNPNVRQLMVEISNADGHIIATGHGTMFLAPGTYNITVWPYDFRALARIMQQVEISANTTVKKELEFVWPYIEKAVKRQGYKPITTLKRRHPIGVGTLHLAVTINGVVKALVAEVNANKLGYNGQESTSFYQYHSFQHGGDPGLPLPITLSLPEGDYRVHVRPYGLAEQVIALEIHAGQTISQSLSVTASDFSKLKVVNQEGEKMNIATSCFDQVQGKISWGNAARSTRWSPVNINRLCRGQEHSGEPPACFDRVMHGGITHGDGAHWTWQDALDLCEGTPDASKTIACLEREVRKGSLLKQAIKNCDK